VTLAPSPESQHNAIGLNHAAGRLRDLCAGDRRLSRAQRGSGNSQILAAEIGGFDKLQRIHLHVICDRR
jgi:hypothetical protein